MFERFVDRKEKKAEKSILEKRKSVTDKKFYVQDDGDEYEYDIHTKNLMSQLKNLPITK